MSDLRVTCSLLVAIFGGRMACSGDTDAVFLLSFLYLFGLCYRIVLSYVDLMLLHRIPREGLARYFTGGT